VQPRATETAQQTTPQPVEPVVVGLDGGYVRSRHRHRHEERHFEVVAGKVIDADGNQSRFAFARNSPTIASDAFQQALTTAGVQADTPATVLCDGDAGLWRLQREALPEATVVLDWWHAAVRFEHALQAARGLGAGTANTHLADEVVRGLGRAKGRLWHGRWPGCRRKLAALCRWTQRKHVRDAIGIGRLQRHVRELLGYLERNEGALVHYAARGRCGEPISTAFVESAVNKIVAKRMNKKQQMRWNRTTVQPFLDVRTAVLNDTLEDAFRSRHPGFRPVNDDQATAAAVAHGFACSLAASGPPRPSCAPAPPNGRARYTYPEARLPPPAVTARPKQPQPPVHADRSTAPSPCIPASSASTQLESDLPRLGNPSPIQQAWKML
jgi:hypothetical protein